MTHPSTAILDSQLNDGVLRLTKQNADENYGMSLAMLDALSTAFDDARENAKIRAIVIDAGGRGFHSGAIAVTQLQPTLEALGRDDFQRLVQLGHALGKKIAQLPMPVIAIARGGALGGGLELLLRSDFIYCLEQSRFSFPEVTLGFVAAWGGTQLSARLMPFRRAQEMLLLGEGLTGRQAEDYGLVTRAFSTNEALEAHLESVLTRLRVCSPASLRWTKECLYAAWDGALEIGLEKELEAETETMASGDFLKGLAALNSGGNFDYVAGTTIVKPRRQ